ncbi:MAG: hypothetical protein B7Y39_04710 [Bdellovibrio sp. 28-41-41]|nr:MAG: hypothetical protein B7Y39_04710 [Bdellovibrio sp. 28-41-41]
MDSSQIKIKKGAILVYRLFDIAEEINIPQVEAILQDNRGPDRFRVPKYIDRAIQLKKPPVSFGLGEEVFTAQNRTFKADVIMKLRDFGTLSIIYQINIPTGTSWKELIDIAQALEEGSEIDSLAKQQSREITKTISSAIKKPSAWDGFEDYIVYFVEEFESGFNAEEFIKEADFTALMLAENQVKLSKDMKAASSETIYQYGENDLAIIEWNSAIVIEPSGSRDVPDILEFGITQLMEMRYYDDLLDDKLNTLYDDIQKKRHSIWASKYDRLYEDASSRYIEFIEFLERVENSLKVVGDFYLAKIYRGAATQFRIKDWQDSVTRKMNILAQVSNLLQGEMNVRRSHLLEIIIVLLITYEIISAVFKTN